MKSFINRQVDEIMTKRLLALYIALIFLMTSYIPAMGADTPTQEKPQLFSNEDIEKYKRPDDKNKTISKPAAEETKKTGIVTKKQLKDQNEWCKRATIQKKKIESEQETIKNLEADKSPGKAPNTYSLRKNNANNKKIGAAKSRLKKAEDELNALENEAHRKGIPAGWLRCDFD